MGLRYAFPRLAWTATHCRIDALFVGVTLRYFRDVSPQAFARIARTRNLAIAAVLLTALALPHNTRTQKTIGFTCLSLAFAIVLAWAVERKPHWTLRPFAYIGFYSYSIYLWQQAFTPLYLGHGGIAALVFATALAIAWGVGMAKLIEIPMLRVRDRLFPAHSAAYNTARLLAQRPAASFRASSPG